MQKKRITKNEENLYFVKNAQMSVVALNFKIISNLLWL